MTFSERLGRQLQRFLDAGSWKILLESEGITENLERDKFRWQLIDWVLSPLALSQFMVEADEEEVLSKSIEIYGSKYKYDRWLLEGAQNGRCWDQPRSKSVASENSCEISGGEWTEAQGSVEGKGVRFIFFSRPAQFVMSTSCPVENIKNVSFRGGMVPQ